MKYYKKKKKIYNVLYAKRRTSLSGKIFLELPIAKFV